MPKEGSSVSGGSSTASASKHSAVVLSVQIEVIVPGVRSVKLNSPRFNQFDKQ